MGCCQSREVTIPQKPQREVATPRSLSFHGVIASYPPPQHARATSVSTMIASDYVRRYSSLSIPESKLMDKKQLQAIVTQDTLTHGYFLDPKARELEAYVISLQAQSNWQLLDSHDSIRIEGLPDSRYSPSTLVFRAEVRLSPRIKPNLAVMVLDNPDFRTQWDSSTREMTVVYVADENAYLRNYVLRPEPPMEEREFLEKCQIRVVEGELRMVWYSIDDPVRPTQDFPPKLMTPRATTFFGMVQFTPLQTETSLQITQQVNTCQKACDLDDEIALLLEWVLKLRDAIEAKAY